MTTIPGFERSYLARPEAPGPGVLVCHDWFGLLPPVERLCDDLAAAGFTALAPSVYGDRTTTDTAEAEQLLSTFDEPWVLPAAAGAAGHLRSLVAPGAPVCSFGFSAGAGLALRLAAEGAVDGAISVYGIVGPSEEERIAVPLQLHWAAVDDWEPYPPDLPQRFVERLRARGLEVESFDYPGTEHSFCNPAAAQYDAEAAARVSDRAVAFVRARSR